MKKIIVILLAVALLAGAASTFVTQNLVVQQTSNLAVATASSLGLTGSATAPLLTQCNASPPTGTSSTGSMCLDVTSAVPWVYTGAAWVQVGSSSGASIAISAGTPSTVNETTLGTYDWLYTSPPNTSKGDNSWHGRKQGGFLMESFDWVTHGSAGSIDTRSWLNTSTVTDDRNTNAFAGVTANLNGFNTAPSGVENCGFRFRLPSDGGAHTVFWQGTIFNSNTKITASLSCPGLVTPQTMTWNTVGGSGADYRVVINWTGPRGCDLVVDHVVTLCIGGTNCTIFVGPIIAS